MDIDDILAGVAVDHDAIPQGTLNLQALTRTWVTERVSPELMPYPDGLMERTMERIRRQVRFFLSFSFGLGRPGGATHTHRHTDSNHWPIINMTS